MTDDLRGPAREAPIDGAPTWLRALQAALIGLVAGFALQALLSLVVVYGETPGAAKQPARTQCKKTNPASDAAATPPALRLSGAVRGAAGPL